jgi:HD-GYP domain-containing protein (c-di-GMP phosphodiesterase class II)
MVLVTSAAAVFAAVTLVDHVNSNDWPRLVSFFGMAAVASSVRIVDRSRSITPSTVITYLAIYVLSPAEALLVTGLGRAVGFGLSRGWVPWRAIFNGSQGGLSVAAGALVFQAFGGLAAGSASLATYIAVLAGPVVQQATNTFLVAMVSSRISGTPTLSTWLGFFRGLFWTNMLSVPTAYALATISLGAGYAVTFAYLALLPFQWQALRLYVRRRELYGQIAEGLVLATDFNFPPTSGHARRVAEIALAVCRDLALGEDSTETVQTAALIHDVGMIGKDDLLESREITEQDALSLREHARIGADVARALPNKDIAEIILGHHEHFDGTGYPNGLSGERIPRGARIVALAEAVESMRVGMFPYNRAHDSRDIVARVRADRGRAFDPQVVDAFLKVADKVLDG